MLAQLALWGGDSHAEPLFTEEQLRALLATATGLPAQADRQPLLLYLSDRADGVAGHYAIARWNPAGYREVWNLRSHRWSSFSDDVLNLEQAQELLKQVAIPTAPQAQADARDAERWRAARDGVKSGDREIYVYTTKHGFGTKLLGSAADADVDAAIAAAKGE